MSGVKKGIVFLKVFFLCLVHALLIAKDRMNGELKGASYIYLLKISWKFLVLILPMAEVLRNFDSFQNIFRTTKLLFMTEWAR